MAQYSESKDSWRGAAMANDRLTECSVEHLMRIAHIIGDLSAAKLALEDRDRRRAAGEDAVIYLDNANRRFLVGPRIQPETASVPAP